MSRPGDVFFATPESERETTKAAEVEHYERDRFIRGIAVACIRAGLAPSTVASSVVRILKDLDASVE